jgi:hypothetical protein
MENKQEKITVDYVYVNKNGYPSVLLKRQNNTFCCLQSKSYKPFPYDYYFDKNKIEQYAWISEEEKNERMQQSLNAIESSDFIEDNSMSQTLSIYNIDKLYHFTPVKYLKSIKEHDGLRCLKYLSNKNIIPHSTGNSKDAKWGLDYYVHLSFCKDHPMRHRIEKTIILEISTDVIFLKNTLFSDINAVDNAHRHGGGFEAFNELIKFEVINNGKKTSYQSLSYIDRKKFQAEVLVRQHIPLSQILNWKELETKYLQS